MEMFAKENTVVSKEQTKDPRIGGLMVYKVCQDLQHFVM